MVSFHLLDVPTQHHTPAPSVIQPLSPSSPSSPLLPPPASLTSGSHTAGNFPIYGHQLSSSSTTTTISLAVDAATFGYLLVAALGTCLICGSIFQWVTEKGLFRRTLFEKANQYNVIVAATALATLLQTLACLVDALASVEGPTKLILTILILISWIMMTHGSVMIVARKLSLTYNTSAENAWNRLLYINAFMMIPTIVVGITWVGNRHDYHNEDMLYDEIYRYVGPIELVLWGLLELILSGLYIIQMRKYHWDEVEKKGVLTLLVVALCDIGLICMNIVLVLLCTGDDDDNYHMIQQISASTACVRGLVYALRIRLELNVLSSMVSYIQKKRKQVFYQAIEQRKKRRRAMLKLKLSSGKRYTGGGSSSGADLLDDDDDDHDDNTDASGTNRSGTDSIFKRFHSNSSQWRRRRRRRRNEKNDSDRIDDFDNDDNDDSSNHSILNMLRRRNNRRSKSRNSDRKVFDNHNDSDASTSSQMSIFNRLPHATDFSNIFQRNFLEDFAIATQQRGNMFSHSLQSLGKKCRDIAKNATDNLSVASGRSFGSKKKKRRGMGSSTLRTQTTVRNSTSSCEIPIQGMEIKLTQPSVPESQSKEHSESLHDDSEMDLEAATENKAATAGKVPGSQTHHYASSVSDLDIGLSSSGDDSDDESEDDSDIHDIDHDVESTTEDTRSFRDDEKQLKLLKTPFKQLSQQSLVDDAEDSDSDDEDDDDDEGDDRSAGMMFGIPRSSFNVKSHPNYNFDLIGENDSGAEAEGIEQTAATSMTLRTTAAIAARAEATCNTSGQQQQQQGEERLPSFRRCQSLNNQKLPPLRRSRTLRESRLARIGLQDRLRREDSVKDDCSAELQRAFDQLESMDCL